MPHFGQAPGLDSRTSGSIGQTYTPTPSSGFAVFGVCARVCAVRVFSACGSAVHMSGVFVLLSKKLVGIFFKFRQAVLAAEVIGLSVVLVLPGSALWIPQSCRKLGRWPY